MDGTYTSLRPSTPSPSRLSYPPSYRVPRSAAVNLASPFTGKKTRHSARASFSSDTGRVEGEAISVLLGGALGGWVGGLWKGGTAAICVCG